MTSLDEIGPIVIGNSFSGIAEEKNNRKQKRLYRTTFLRVWKCA